MPRKELFIGIDVAKDVLDVAIRPTGDAWQVTNDEVGIADLVKRLKVLRPTLIVLEATGRLHVAAVGALAAAKLPVQAVNPRQVQDFGRGPANWPRPMRSTPAFWRTSRMRFVQRCGRWPMPNPGAEYADRSSPSARRNLTASVTVGPGSRRAFVLRSTNTWRG